MRTNWREIAVCSSWFLIFAFSGCSGCLQIASNKPSYAFNIYNCSGEDIEDMNFLWGTVWFFQDGLRHHQLANGGKGYAFYTYDVPPVATVRWETKNQRLHEVTANVPHVSSEHLHSGEFFLMILPNAEVRIAFLTQDDLQDVRNWLSLQALMGYEGPQYVIGTQNATSTKLKEIRVFFGDHQVNGDGRADAASTDPTRGWRFTHLLPYPVTDEARVEWTTPDEIRHQTTVPMKTHLPDDLNGLCIAFVITDDQQVELKTFPHRLGSVTPDWPP